MSGSFDPSNYVLILVAGTIYLHVNQPESALKVLHASDHLECYALKIQVSFLYVFLINIFTLQIISGKYLNIINVISMLSEFVGIYYELYCSF